MRNAGLGWPDALSDSSRMATIAIGDIHGNLPALIDLLDQLGGQIEGADTIVFLGDYIDKGPDSKQCVETILQFRLEVPATVVCLCGNHEDWLLRTMRDYQRHSWLLGMEALDTIRSYSSEAAQVLLNAISEAGLRLYTESDALPYDAFFDVMPESHLRFFESLQTYYESPECICVHAGLSPQVARIEEQSRHSLMLGDRSFPALYQGPKTVVYGHWRNPVIDGNGWPMPRIIGRTIGIDTIAQGVLTALRLPGQQVFQSARHHPSGVAV